jgi:hypothetical protein
MILSEILQYVVIMWAKFFLTGIGNSGWVYEYSLEYSVCTGDMKYLISRVVNEKYFHKTNT